MAGCKLTKSLDGKLCEYAIAGARALYIANYFPPTIYSTATPTNAIAYEFDEDGYLSGIYLPSGESFYEVKGENNTMSFTDTLLAGSNGGKYRQHTVNAVLNQYDIDVLDTGDALSLGKFVVVAVDNAGRIMALGRQTGLSAPAGGFDYNSGAAEADATGWTILLQGSSMEIAPIVKDLSVITPIYPGVVPV
jgi:hypothetical protein